MTPVTIKEILVEATGNLAIGLSLLGSSGLDISLGTWILRKEINLTSRSIDSSANHRRLS